METRILLDPNDTDPVAQEVAAAIAAAPPGKPAVAFGLIWRLSQTMYQADIPHLVDVLPEWLAAAHHYTVELRDTGFYPTAPLDLVRLNLEIWYSWLGSVPARTWLVSVKGADFAAVHATFLELLAQSTAALVPGTPKASS